MFLTIFLVLLAAQLHGQMREVEGRVFSLNNRSMAGVNVLVKGTANGTVTDMNGYFKLPLPPGPVLLLFSYLKQKALEHALTVRKGYQYQINVRMANASQSFNKSDAVTAELPLNSPRLAGTVVNQDGVPLRGVRITQKKSAFTTFSDANGTFDVPVPNGENVFTFSFGGVKPLAFSLEIEEGLNYEVEILLVEDKHKYRMLESSVTQTLIAGEKD